jgi:RNA polymerase sigma factor FliA
LDEPSSVERLWEEFKLKASADARERLILHYAPLVKYVAGRVSVGLPPNIEQADLVSYGIFGLIDAIEKYDLERGIKFETYAISRIKGAIIDELRAIDWIPRSVRFKAREVEKAYVALENRLHRSPSDAEVAQQLGITTDELHQIFNQISFVSVVALDELLSVGSERGDRLSLVDTLEDKGAEDPVAVFESQEMKGILANSINRLGEREKIVITLYYYEDSPWPRSGRSWASPSRGSARCTPRPCSSSGRRCRTRADGPVPGGSERVVATVAASRAGPVVIATVAAGRAGPD